MTHLPPPPYPPIEPTTFDLIIVGTGLPESVISAAAAASGKSVLHLDPNPFYGSHYASLSVPDLISFLNSNSTPPTASTTTTDTDTLVHAIVGLTTRRLYSDVEISSYSPELLEELSRKFNIDVAGPRVLFCADKCIDIMLKSGASQYVEFKSIDASFVGGENGKLWNVPDSRAAIFKDRSLSLMEKNQLMRFFKLVQAHLAENEDAKQEEGEERENTRISEEDLEIPFVEFLTKMRLPPKIKTIILYAIAMADYDQENMGASKGILRTRDGIDRLALYQSSVGRFSNALGAMIYSIYGQGELPQAFCRRAAVKGCIYVLRMPVVALLMEKSSGCYKGVRLASGQDLFCCKLILDPSLKIQSPSVSPSDPLHGSLKSLSMRDVKRKVARGICITRRSLKSDVSNLMVVYPPQSLYPEQLTSVRVLQIGSNLAVCPHDMFVLYFSTLCDDANQGKKLINAAISAVVSFPDSVNPDSSSKVTNETIGEGKTMLIWSASYIQEQTMDQDQLDSINFTPMPDGSLNYDDVLDAAVKIFEMMYPNEVFLPKTASPENFEGNGDKVVRATKTIKLDIMPGVDDGETIKVARCGGADPDRNQNGDLFVTIKAILGGTIQVPTLTGDVVLKVSKQEGQTIFDDLNCRNLTPSQRELIEEFAKEERGEFDKRAAGASR
ncbi:hypothetical protein K2173_009181 [Erythroxylum novogranatense]|uniref:Rab proteins geranylgeranyltransferase component n=1 Tax=Erythroxylum novogranatense TaxID=1862640 RepID=A0AAV8TEW8_9ROSI|nr:hypothetical protein K2173_009181 [Erythroxylum novogranatense]